MVAPPGPRATVVVVRPGTAARATPLKSASVVVVTSGMFGGGFGAAWSCFPVQAPSASAATSELAAEIRNSSGILPPVRRGDLMTERQPTGRTTGGRCQAGRATAWAAAVPPF